jgi:hypothetical protein
MALIVIARRQITSTCSRMNEENVGVGNVATVIGDPPFSVFRRSFTSGQLAPSLTWSVR